MSVRAPGRFLAGKAISPRFSPSWLRWAAGFRSAPLAVVLIVVAVLVLYPLLTLVYASFRDAAPGQPSSFTLRAWQDVLEDPRTFTVLATTMTIALPRAFLALAAATTFAWLLARTNTPFKLALEGMLAFMFFLPDLPWVLAWGLLGAPRTGFLNQWTQALVPGSPPLVNVYSYWGLVILGAARSAPIIFLFIYSAFLAMDANLEEASRMSGAGIWRTLREIDLPLLLPALLASGILSLVRATESFEMEQLLGTPAHIYVFTTRIYEYLYASATAQYGPAMVMSMMLIVLTLGLVIVRTRALKGRSYTTITGSNFQARRYNLGPWRWLSFALILGFFLIFGVLPFAVLALDSFMKVGGFIDMRLLTTAQWSSALSKTSLLDSIRNTLIFAAASATLSVVACLGVSYIVKRTSWRGRGALDFMSWLPLGVPGIVIALGFLWAFVYLPIFGTLWMLIIVQVARSFPIGSQAFGSTIVQVDKELEEASRVHGGGWLQTFRHVWMPLLRPAVISAWMLFFVIAVRVLDTVVLLAGPGTRVLSVDIFQLASSGRSEQASVLALLQTGLIVCAYIVSRLLFRTSPSPSAVTA